MVNTSYFKGIYPMVSWNKRGHLHFTLQPSILFEVFKLHGYENNHEYFHLKKMILYRLVSAAYSEFIQR